MTVDLDAIRRREMRNRGMCAPANWDINDLIAEVERLRAVAWQLHGAMIDQHREVEHVLNDDCPPCEKAAAECDPFYACDGYKARQMAYVGALGLVIEEKPS